MLTIEIQTATKKLNMQYYAVLKNNSLIYGVVFNFQLVSRVNICKWGLLDLSVFLMKFVYLFQDWAFIYQDISEYTLK